MANKRIIELNERTVINMGDYLMVDDATGSRKLAMSTLFNYLTYSSLMFVDTLPTTDIDPTVIYLVPHSGSTTQWDEYIYRDNQWILIGTSTLDLTSIYQTKTDNNLQTTSKQIVGAINEEKSALVNVDGYNNLLSSSYDSSKHKTFAESYGSISSTGRAITKTITLDNSNVKAVYIKPRLANNAELCYVWCENTSATLSGTTLTINTTLKTDITTNSNVWIEIEVIYA